MDNFIFSINATVPIFLVIIVGYFLKQWNILDDHFATVANRFNFKITLPILLFKDLASADILGNFDGNYVVFCMIVTSASFWVIWGLSKLLIKDKRIVGAFVQGSFRGSAAVLGIAFIQNMYGNSGMAPLMILGTVPLYNIYSVIVLTFEAEHKGDGSQIKKALINIVKNPIIIAIVLGLAGSVLHIFEFLPQIFSKTVTSMASMATPLALITIGVGFEGRKALAKVKPTIAASFIKLMLLPMIFLPIAEYMGFREQKMIALLIMLGAPTTVSAYIMAKNMDNDGVLTSSIVVVTTLLSSVTMTWWIYYLRTRGLI